MTRTPTWSVTVRSGSSAAVVQGRPRLAGERGDRLGAPGDAEVVDARVVDDPRDELDELVRRRQQARAQRRVVRDGSVDPAHGHGPDCPTAVGGRRAARPGDAGALRPARHVPTRADTDREVDTREGGAAACPHCTHPTTTGTTRRLRGVHGVGAFVALMLLTAGAACSAPEQRKNAVRGAMASGRLPEPRSSIRGPARPHRRHERTRRRDDSGGLVAVGRPGPARAPGPGPGRAPARRQYPVPVTAAPRTAGPPDPVEDGPGGCC